MATARDIRIGSKYLVIGGMAIIHHGYLRTTEDIDILLEGSPENQRRVCSALETLPERAILELGQADLRDYVVVRVADEIVVDLMLAACGIAYEEAIREVSPVEMQGVSIPFAAPALLLQMKQTFRDKDAADRIFLRNKIAGRENDEPGFPPV